MSVRSDRMDPRTPVLVGVGVASDDAEATDLMSWALHDAAWDAGAPEILDAIDRIAVPQGSWTYSDPGRLVADAVGAKQAQTHLVELGIPQQSLINEALSAILDGSADVSVVVGGEAKRWSQNPGAVETPQPGVVPDVTRRRPAAIVEPVEGAAGLWQAVRQYAMIENALRAADGQTIDAHRREISELWARFNLVARSNPSALFPEPMTAEAIDLSTPDNRPLAFPYNKWHSTQWTVNQAAALLLCSAGTAHRFGISSDRWIFPLVGIESSQAVSLLRRDQPHTWPAMGVLGRAASARIGRPVAGAEVMEAYSCFPAAVRVTQRELGLDLSGTPTITGGMAFAGGPFNNFGLQSTAAVVAALRERPEAMGVVTTVSGLLTKPGLGVWSTAHDGRPPLLGDLAAEAEEATGVVEVVETLDGYGGDATVVTYTVIAEGEDPMQPATTVVLCDTADGRRCVAVAHDPELALHATTHELIGSRVSVEAGSFHLG